MQEAEEADRLALREIFRVHSEGAQADDAIFEIVVARDCFAMSLMPRLAVPKQLKIFGGKGRDNKSHRSNTRFHPYKGGKDRFGKGKGKFGRWSGGKRGSGSGKSADGGKGRDGQHAGAGTCNRFQNGNCHDSSCKYKHACAKCGSEAHGAQKCVRS